MDPLTYYRFGLARQEDMIREAEQYRAANALPAEPSRWQRLIARLTQAKDKHAEQPCPEILASAQ